MNKQDIILTKTPKDQPSPNTREAAAARQAKIDRDTAEFITSGGQVKELPAYYETEQWTAKSST